MITRHRKKGFTLIETILACVILCASVLVLGAISTRSLSGLMLNRQYETATALAEKQLVLIDYVGIEDFIRSGRFEGDLEHLGLVYRWLVSTKRVGIDNLYEVKVNVNWMERNRNYDVSVCTRLNGTGALDETAGL